MINFSVPLAPVPWPRPRFDSRTKKIVYNKKNYEDFKTALGYFALQAMRGKLPFTGAVKITADFFKPRPKKSKFHCGQFPIIPYFGDIDNHLKAVLDSLTGICYEDDRQVCEAHARKFFGRPHIEISLEELK